ncbi:uncharacterized protein LOC133859644 [Alnus glutinosa]|uniref:uncharacterized protein LOC133859644 n=1 Tax=Alnus glutinosa TaxID=3517 RepID=UPI002D76528E|nr:uncharacterized protein LOC133859644 [Alnus glutinosa]
MLPRCHPFYDFNHDPRLEENGEEELPPPPPPPPYNDGIHPILVQFITDATRHLVKAISRIPRPNERAKPIGCSLRDFASYHFRTFERTEGSNAAEARHTNINVLFNTLGCTDEHKVRYIALQLMGEAGRWWNARKVLLEDETVITWEMFKVEYNQRFFPRAQRFMELVRFAANLIPDKESKAGRFENERGIQESAAAYDLKRQLKQQTSYSEKRRAIENDSKLAFGRSFSPALGNQRPPCNRCVKLHGGKCKMTGPTCFQCGKTSNFQKYCPMNFEKGSKP